MSDPYQLVSHTNFGMVKKSFPRTLDAEIWNDADSTRLVDLLEDLDELKLEIHERMKRLDAVQQARSLIREDALRTQSLNQKLDDFGRAVNMASVGPDSWEKRRDEPEIFRMPLRDTTASFPEIEANTEHSSDVYGDVAELRSTQEREKPVRSTLDEQAAAQELQEAKQARQQANDDLAEAKLLFEQSINNLNEAKTREEKSAADARSTQQELTTAYQFASVAAQRQHDAWEFFRKANLWAVNAAALSWVATIWFAWVAFRAHLSVWEPGVMTAVVLLLAVFMARWGTSED